MEIIHTVAELRARLKSESNIGFVPTMGNLHAGHIDLTRIARTCVNAHSPDQPGAGGCVAVSIFVNRLQFGPKEDFGSYPRTFADDTEKCCAAGVDIVFAPTEAAMYPAPQHYLVEPPKIQHILDGAMRPGHFRGVATVVLKLFNMVRPTVAVFGKKDYQQCRVLDNMVQQLNLPIEMVLADTVRADDGLALSSRNGYLSAAERIEAPQLFAELSKLKHNILSGERNFAAMEAGVAAALDARGWKPDYIAVRRSDDLLEPSPADKKLVILAAARLGATRLIDNVEVTLDE